MSHQSYHLIVPSNCTRGSVSSHNTYPNRTRMKFHIISSHISHHTFDQIIHPAQTIRLRLSARGGVFPVYRLLPFLRFFPLSLSTQSWLKKAGARNGFWLLLNLNDVLMNITARSVNKNELQSLQSRIEIHRSFVMSLI